MKIKNLETKNRKAAAMKFVAVFASLTLMSCAQASPAPGNIGNLARFDIYDRSAQRMLPVYWHRGQAYVVGRPGNEYQIVLRNRIDNDVLAVVSVDGINVISGETAAPQQSGYVLDAGQRMEIAGWRKSMRDTAAFYFTSLGDSYAGRTGRPNNVGVIGVALFQRKAERVSIAPYGYENGRGYGYEADSQRRAQAPSSSDESRESAPAVPANAAAGTTANRDRAETGPRTSGMAEKSRADSPLGTGHGRSEIGAARYVGFERRSPIPDEQIAIYYDSHANLVARGVIPAQPAPPREPQPFPGSGGFVPDPRW